MMGINRFAMICAALLSGGAGAMDAPDAPDAAPAAAEASQAAEVSDVVQAPDAVGAPAAVEASVETEPEPEDRDWSLSAVAYTYIVPEGTSYVQPTVTADYRWLHLEMRCNYEDLQTGSVWIGYNFSFGEELVLEFTPMVGGVFGRTSGIAPGLNGFLGWWWLELYGEVEWVFDAEEYSDSFFYCWSELTLSPVDWLRVGLVAQRTQAYETDLEIQRGFLVGLSYKQVELTGHMFNPDQDEPVYVISLGADF